MTGELYLTYLKDHCEMLLRVDGGTCGDQYYYRRMPPDTAGPERIHSFMNRGGITSPKLSIRILLFPPEVLTLVAYLPNTVKATSLRQAVCSEILPGLQYPHAYDLQHFPMSRYPNGHGDQMVIVSLLGKQVLPGLRRVLGGLSKQVSFIGDGLQFLEYRDHADEVPQKAYQVLLRHADRTFIAGFRGGRHTASCSLTHATQQILNARHSRDQARYLNLRGNDDLLTPPTLAPISPPRDWHSLDLPRHAFPLWLLASRSREHRGVLNHFMFFREMKPSSHRIRKSHPQRIQAKTKEERFIA